MVWVSILTPVYNSWQLLEQCALGVFLQKTGHGENSLTWEWWIGVNGHGPSGGAAYQEALRMKDLWLRHAHGSGTVHVVNLPSAHGKVEAMNALVQHASGEWVAVLDCDDTWDRNKLISQKVVIDGLSSAVDAPRSRLAVVGTPCWYFGDISSGGPSLPSGWIAPETVMDANPLINSSALIRRELAHWSDAFPGLDDYDLWCRLALEGWRFYNLSERLVHHRIHSGSAFNAKGVQDVDALRAHYRPAFAERFTREGDGNGRTEGHGHPADVTVVTAYYPIKSKFSVEKYLNWIAEFWTRTSCPLVFFTDPALAPHLEALLSSRPGPLRMISLPFQEFVAFRKFGGGHVWVDAHRLDPEKDTHTPELYATWYEKKEFVRRAIALDPFKTDFFVWCDAGISRIPEWISRVSHSFPQTSRIPRGRMMILQLNPFEETERQPDVNGICGDFTSGAVRLGGGILASDRAGWDAWSDTYDAMCIRYLKTGRFIGKDQNLMGSIVLEKPDLAELIESPSTLTSMQRWFYLLLYLAGENAP